MSPVRARAYAQEVLGVLRDHLDLAVLVDPTGSVALAEAIARNAERPSPMFDVTVDGAAGWRLKALLSVAGRVRLSDIARPSSDARRQVELDVNTALTRLA